MSDDSMSNRSHCLLIIDSHPVQYRVPIYQALSRELEKSGARLHVVYGSNSSVRGAMDAGFGQAVTWDEPMLEGYSHEFLPGAEEEKPGCFMALRGAGVERRVRELAPDVVFLNGVNYLLMVRSLFASRLAGIPVWLRSETQDLAFARSSLKHVVRAAVYRVLYSQITRFLPIGKLNAAHYAAHGVSLRQMAFCHYCVVDRFDGDPSDHLETRRAKRAELGIGDGERVVMFSGKLIPKKYPGVLLEAWELLNPEERDSFSFLFVGYGEQIN
jgi:glycosyltransferase involved in cell wall biosynthesis